MVRDFMEKHEGYCEAYDLKEAHPAILEFGMRMKTWAKANIEEGLVEFEKGDPRRLRASLMVEELGELMVAMSDCDLVKVADGLADLLYVVLGTAECYDISTQPIFHEVHRSNMTKAVTTDRRVREKGKDYSPPDILRVLKTMGFVTYFRERGL